MEPAVPDKPTLKVVTLKKSNYRDPVATLRVIADEIEAGKFGDVSRVGVVIRGAEITVCGMGRDSDAASMALLLKSGFERLAHLVEEMPTIS